MAHTIYENKVLENKMTDILITQIDLNSYMTVDTSMTEQAGMKKVINTYTATGDVEALAMGLPVISSDGPFNDDILDENNSIRINPDDVDALTDAIRKLRDDKTLRKSMVDYSHSRHEEYSIEGRAKRILGFIDEQIRK